MQSGFRFGFGCANALLKLNVATLSASDKDMVTILVPLV